MSEYVIQGETLTAIADAIRAKKNKKREYTQLEYIESSGTQYIDTGYTITSENLKIVARFMLTELKYWAATWGVEGNEDKTLALTMLLNGSNNLTFYSGSSSQRGAIPITVGTVYDLTCQTIDGAITYTYNGVTGTPATAEGNLCKTKSFYVFTLNSSKYSETINQASKMRLYSFQMYDNDVLVLDLLPCSTTDGTLGLYDLVNEVFYTNAGTGTFTAGSAVGSIEDEPVPIPTTSMAAEILSIETGITPSGTLDIGLNGTHNVSQYEYAKVSITPKLQEKAVTPQATEQMVRPDSGYDGLSLVAVDAMPTVAQATPVITVSAAGLITASATQEEGYVAYGTKAKTKQLTTQGAQTITPGTSNQTIGSGRYLTGTQTIKGDSNLVAGNIKKGVSIFGVTGTHEGATVRMETGAFTLDQFGCATVICGFKPDCVAVFGGLNSGDTVYPGAMFTLAGENLIRLMVPPPTEDGSFTVLPIAQTSDGFQVEYAAVYTGTFVSFSVDTEMYRTFNYVALKYT